MAKFSYTLRIQYSLELMERRIGEMEFLANKSSTGMLPVVGYYYEAEAGKIITEFNSSDIFSYFTEFYDIRKNVTERLEYDKSELGLLSKNVSGQSETYIESAVKKTQECIDFIRMSSR
jgi:hypothetical protein